MPSSRTQRAELTLPLTLTLTLPLTRYAKGGGGFYALNVTLALDANGRLLPNSSTAAAALLDCEAPSDSGVRSRMLQWHGLMDAQLGDAQCPTSNAHCPTPNALMP